MVMKIENISAQGLILIEEIENGLHPLATLRLVEYLIDVADRKSIQIVFTTHSEYAIAPLPAEAVWAALDGTAIQGKLDIHSLRSLTGEINSKLVVYTEDIFAKEWVETIFRSDASIASDAIEVYAMGGDGTAVTANKYHNLDPSSQVKSICILDGDSRQRESIDENIFRLPGETPELYVFDRIADKLEECSGILAVRFMRKFPDTHLVEKIIQDISNTNYDHHLLYTQIGEKVGFINESIIRGAFLSTWCEEYPDEVKNFLDKVRNFLPKVDEGDN